MNYQGFNLLYNATVKTKGENALDVSVKIYSNEIFIRVLVGSMKTEVTVRPF